MHTTPHSQESKDKIKAAIAARGGAWNKGKGVGRNKELLAAANRRYLERHRERILARNRAWARRHRMRTMYNLTEERYQEMYAQQKGLCILPSCGKPASAIDHCHTLEETRGLMCDGHNMALGLFSHSPKLLREAADYLEDWEKRNGQF